MVMIFGKKIMNKEEYFCQDRVLQRVNVKDLGLKLLFLPITSLKDCLIAMIFGWKVIDKWRNISAE